MANLYWRLLLAGGVKRMGRGRANRTIPAADAESLQSLRRKTVGRQQAKILAIIAVALVVAFVVQHMLASMSGGLALSAAVTVVILIVACALAAVVLKGEGALLRLAEAAAGTEPMDPAEVRAAGPVGEAIAKAHRANIERAHWYEGILNTIPFGISVTDMNMRWTFCNKAALASMGKQATECLGRSCTEKRGNLCNTPNCGIEQLRRGVNKLTNSLPNGRLMSMELEYLTDSKGAKIGHVEISRDITREQELQRQAREAAMSGRLDTVQRLSSAVDRLNQVAEALTNEIGQVKDQVVQASENLTETATAMEEMNCTVLEVARNAEEAARASMTVQEEAASGTHAMEKTVHDMQEVQTRSLSLKEDMSALDSHARDIGEVLTIIRDIADQTNLLALNADIKAARAGEAGRGLAAVADEVRKLAEKTMNATREVDDVISAIQAGTDKSAQTVQNTVEAIDTVAGQARQSGEALAHITNLAENSSSQVQAIAAAATEQSAASEEINRNVGNVSALSDSITRSMESATAEVEEMLKQAQTISDVLERIRAEVEEERRKEESGK